MIKTNYRIWQDMQKRKCRSRNKVFILTVHPVFKGLEMESSSVIISSHRNCFNAIVDDQQHHGVKHHRHLGAWESHLKNGHPNQYITAPKLITSPSPHFTSLFSPVTFTHMSINLINYNETQKVNK